MELNTSDPLEITEDMIQAWEAGLEGRLEATQTTKRHRTPDGWGPNIWMRSGDTFESTLFETGRIMGVRGPYMTTEILQKALFTNCDFEGQGETYWLNRIYDVASLGYIGCRFKHAGHHNPYEHSGKKTEKWEGHGCYLNVFGSVLWQDCTFEDNLGQGVQVCWRPNETVVPRNPAGHLVFKNVSFLDMAQYKERGANAIALFNPGQSVRLHNVAIGVTDRFPEFPSYTSSTVHRSRGGLTIADPRRFGRTSPLLQIDGLAIHHDRPDRAHVTIMDVKKVRGEKLFLTDTAGPAELDYHPQSCRDIHLEFVDCDVDIYEVDRNHRRQGAPVSKIRGGGVFDNDNKPF